MMSRQRGPNTANNVPIGNVGARSRGPQGQTSGVPTASYKFASEARKLVDMGFEMTKVQEALIRTNGRVDEATTILLGDGDGTEKEAEVFSLNQSQSIPTRPLSAAEILAGKTRTSAMPAGSASGVWGGSISGAAMVATMESGSSMGSSSSLSSSQLQTDAAGKLGSVLGLGLGMGRSAAEQAGGLAGAGVSMSKQDKIETKHQKFMSTFKVLRCREKTNHDKRNCAFWHSKADRRRDPYGVEYSCSECPDYTEASPCAEGDNCLKAHNMLERMFHPDLFKISMCQKPRTCERGDLCAFAHSEEDHRIAPPKTANLAYSTPALEQKEKEMEEANNRNSSNSSSNSSINDSSPTSSGLDFSTALAPNNATVERRGMSDMTGALAGAGASNLNGIGNGNGLLNGVNGLTGVTGVTGVPLPQKNSSGPARSGKFMSTTSTSTTPAVLSEGIISQLERSAGSISREKIPVDIKAQAARDRAARAERTLQERLVKVIKASGPEGIMSSELPKRYELTYNEKLDLSFDGIKRPTTGEAGGKRIKDLLLTQAGISVAMHKGVHSMYVYDAEQAAADAKAIRVLRRQASGSGSGSTSGNMGIAGDEVGSMGESTGVTGFSSLVSGGIGDGSIGMSGNGNGNGLSDGLSQHLGVGQGQGQGYSQALGIGGPPGLLGSNSGGNGNSNGNSASASGRRRGPPSNMGGPIGGGGGGIISVGGSPMLDSHPHPHVDDLDLLSSLQSSPHDGSSSMQNDFLGGGGVNVNVNGGNMGWMSEGVGEGGLPGLDDPISDDFGMSNGLGLDNSHNSHNSHSGLGSSDLGSSLLGGGLWGGAHSHSHGQNSMLQGVSTLGFDDSAQAQNHAHAHAHHMSSVSDRSSNGPSPVGLPPGFGNDVSVGGISNQFGGGGASQSHHGNRVNGINNGINGQGQDVGVAANNGISSGISSGTGTPPSSSQMNSLSSLNSLNSRRRGPDFPFTNGLDGGSTPSTQDQGASSGVGGVGGMGRESPILGVMASPPQAQSQGSIQEGGSGSGGASTSVSSTISELRLLVMSLQSEISQYSIRDAQHKDKNNALSDKVKDLQDNATGHDKAVRVVKEAREVALNDWRKAGSDLAVERKRSGERDSDMVALRQNVRQLEKTLHSERETSVKSKEQNEDSKKLLTEMELLRKKCDKMTAERNKYEQISKSEASKLKEAQEEVKNSREIRKGYQQAQNKLSDATEKISDLKKENEILFSYKEKYDMLARLDKAYHDLTSVAEKEKNKKEGKGGNKDKDKDKDSKDKDSGARGVDALQDAVGNMSESDIDTIYNEVTSTIINGNATDKKVTDSINAAASLNSASANTNTDRTCSLPSCNTKGLFICSTCKGVSYCGPEHQRQDWRVHKKNCVSCK